MTADPAILVDGGQAADDRVVLDLDVAGDGAVVGKNHGVAHHAIVRDVAVRQEISSAADARAGVRRGPAMHGHEFAEGVAIADAQLRRLAAVFQILRLLADRGACVEDVLRADDASGLAR